MKLKEITLSVFSLVMIGFLLLGSQNVHTLIYHSADDDSDAIVHCEQCDFIYTNNHTSFLDLGYTTVSIPYIYTENHTPPLISNYKEPYAKDLFTSYYLSRPPPTA